MVLSAPFCDIKRIFMKEKNWRLIGIWVLCYSLFVGLINLLWFHSLLFPRFWFYFFRSRGILWYLYEYSDKDLNFYRLFVTISFCISALPGFLSALCGAVALIKNKTWGQRISLLGIELSIIFPLIMLILASFVLAGGAAIFYIPVALFTPLFILGRKTIRKVENESRSRETGRMQGSSENRGSCR